jgi:phage-related baseplate assembly protein
MNLLSYARGEYLDVLGDLVGVFRLDPQPSLATIEFTLSTARDSVYTVPKGTEVTDGELIWATTEPLDIPAGDLSGTVSAECETAGETGNGRVAGQINVMVEPLEYIDSAENITESTGGADTETDDNLRERIRLAPSSFSVAGPAAAYRYWARTANQSIVDVSVLSPTPGVVEVRPLMAGGEIPDSDVLNSVADVLKDDSVRPLTDDVDVLAPAAASYDVTVDYWISEANATQITAIQDAVDKAVADYVDWQKAKIGRDINPDELTRQIRAAGAKRITITSPSFTVLDNTEVAQEGTITVSYQGTEDA